MKYMWEVIINSPKDVGQQLHLYGVAANINIAISKAKKKVKEDFKLKPESDDLVVVNVNMLHPVEF